MCKALTSIFIGMGIFSLLYFASNSESSLNFPAHVSYVIDVDETRAVHQSAPDPFFPSTVFNNPLVTGIGISIGTLVFALILYFVFRKSFFLQTELATMRITAASYDAFVPWVLRLGLGISLMGASSAKVLISPTLPDFPQFAFVQMVLGFLLVIGFLTGPVLIGVILLFLRGLFTEVYLLGNFDTLAIAIALLMLADGKPSVDDLLGMPFLSPIKKSKMYVPLILRIGIGGMMIFMAVYEKFLNPYFTALVVEKFNLTAVIPVSSELWVMAIGPTEFAIGLALTLGLFTRLIVTITFLVLTSSLFFFGEFMYSHVTLFATLAALYVSGGGALSLDNFFGIGKNRRENVGTSVPTVGAEGMELVGAPKA